MKNFLYILILAIILAGFYFFWSDVPRFFPQFSGIEIEKIVQEVPSHIPVALEKTGKDISSPPPLRAAKESPKSFLTQSGVITWTNIQRNAQGLLPLLENEKLNNSAALKVEDILEKQYFGHISPSGVDVGDLAEAVGYKFITIGENLALGNFESDQALVQAWMDSPGHQENILNSRFTEIGVAAVKGIFEGKPTWIAVQEFGLSLSTCPAPDDLLKIRIENNTNLLQEIEKELKTKQRELSRMRPKWGQKYNEKVNEYNTLVLQYNNLSKATKVMITEYNNQTKAFNSCISG